MMCNAMLMTRSAAEKFVLTGQLPAPADRRDFAPSASSARAFSSPDAVAAAAFSLLKIMLSAPTFYTSSHPGDDGAVMAAAVVAVEHGGGVLRAVAAATAFAKADAAPGAAASGEGLEGGLADPPGDHTS